MLVSERVILHTMAFDLCIQHPYDFVVGQVKRLKGNKDMLQLAWNFINDSYRTTICLRFKPQAVSCASLYLACLMKGHAVPDVEGNGVISEAKMTFLEAFNVSAEEVNEISVTILDMSVHVQFISHARFTHTRFHTLAITCPPQVSNSSF